MQFNLLAVLYYYVRSTPYMISFSSLPRLHCFDCFLSSLPAQYTLPLIPLKLSHHQLLINKAEPPFPSRTCIKQTHHPYLKIDVLVVLFLVHGLVVVPCNLSINSADASTSKRNKLEMILSLLSFFLSRYMTDT